MRLYCYGNIHMLFIGNQPFPQTLKKSINSMANPKIDISEFDAINEEKISNIINIWNNVAPILDLYFSEKRFNIKSQISSALQTMNPNKCS